MLIHGLIKSELATFLSASGIFTFDQNGQLESFAAKRYKEDKGEYSLEDWFVEMKEHREFNGIIIPNKVDVTWQLETGDFTCFTCEIMDVEYNIERR